MGVGVMVRNTSTNAKCGNEALVFIFSFIHEGYTSTANDPPYEYKDELMLSLDTLIEMVSF